MLGHVRSKRAVVNIYVKTSSPHRLKLLPMLPAFTVNLPKQGLGSGFFVHPSGYMNTAGVTTAQGLAFAVPSSHVREFLDGLLKDKGQPAN